MDKKISYTNRDFAGLRQDLVNLTKKYYPDLVNNTNDASIFSVLLDLNAAVTDNLHHHIDRVWQETMLDFAQQRQSLYHIAKTYGLKIPGRRPSVALCDFSINVPVNGDKENSDYLGILKSGAQVSGGGQIFETLQDIDFANPFDSMGTPNRLKIPNFDSNNKLVSYTITKREAVVNGTTRIFRRVITENDQKPFLKIYLPEQNVLGVTSVIHKDGANYTNNPSYSEFESDTNKWYEVNSLIENEVFVKDPTKYSDKDNFVPGKTIEVDDRFITEYTPEGYFSMTFGSGNNEPLTNVDDYVNNNMKVNLSSFLNNMSLGSMPKSNTTLFVKYRIGGGKNSNIGINVINSIDNIEFNVNGPIGSVNNQVIQSLRVNNVTAATGGSDQPTTEEIRNMIPYNFAAQNRAVTLNDYKSIIEKMPGMYGAPAKVSVTEEDNKIKVKLLSYGEDGNLMNSVSTILKNNLMEYLSHYKSPNDLVEITSGKVIDLGLELDIVIDRNQTEMLVVREIIDKTVEYFTINKRKMGDHLFVGDYQRVIGTINGVVNVVDCRVYNMVGGEYSNSEISQPYKDKETREIQQNDMTVFMENDQIYQIRNTKKDVKVRVKTLNNTTS